MRVTNTSTSRNFAASINDVHGRLNKSMNKVSSGKAYESASENPLAYYDGKKIDNQYQDVLSKLSLMTDVKNRVYQQELGARSIQERLSEAKTKITFIRSDSNNGTKESVDTVKSDLLQKMQSMVNDLNAQYENFYVFGGNDLSTPPFSLSDDGKTLTFTHTFAGEDDPTKMAMTMTRQADGSYEYVFSDPDNPGTTEAAVLSNIEKAMKEQGRIDIGYGSIRDKDSLLDTYTGGLNLLTGLSSDAVRAGAGVDKIKKALNNSPIALVGQAAFALEDYTAGGDKATMSKVLGDTLDAINVTEHTVSTVYSDLGNKYALIEETTEKLTDMKIALTSQYTDKLGADPYEAIMEMFANQSSYSAALQVGSNMMRSSLFDFMS